MAARNSERLLNLVIALLVTPRYISREQIRELVEGYAQAKNDVAFQRMFERDKEELRKMGVEVEVGPTDPTTGEMDGYRIPPDGFYLNEIHLTPEESTLVGLASSVWNEPTVAAGVGAAMAKLRAAGEEIAVDQASFLTPRLTAREPAFPVLWEALLSRTPVEFVYHGRTRHVQGWRMILRSGAWYLLGEDIGVGTRMFKLSRIEDLPRLGEGSYALPDAAVIDEHARGLEPPPPSGSVLVAIRQTAAPSLRRRGQAAEVPVPDGFQAVRVPYAFEDEIVSAICAAGPDALVLEAGPIRERVIAQLRAVSHIGSHDTDPRHSARSRRIHSGGAGSDTAPQPPESDPCSKDIS